MSPHKTKAYHKHQEGLGYRPLKKRKRKIHNALKDTIASILPKGDWQRSRLSPTRTERKKVHGTGAKFIAKLFKFDAPVIVMAAPGGGWYRRGGIQFVSYASCLFPFSASFERYAKLIMFPLSLLLFIVICSMQNGAIRWDVLLDLCFFSEEGSEMVTIGGALGSRKRHLLVQLKKFLLIIL